MGQDDPNPLVKAALAILLGIGLVDKDLGPSESFFIGSFNSRNSDSPAVRRLIRAAAVLVAESADAADDPQKFAESTAKGIANWLKEISQNVQVAGQIGERLRAAVDALVGIPD
jgi:hypothetical protein